MGATGWQYYVRYQVDVDAALQELRRGVFQRGEYEKPMTEEEGEAVMANASPQLKKLYELATRWEKFDPPKPDRSSPPRTIEELVEQCEESGTHSILDIDHISEALEFGALTPLTEQQLTDLFNTIQPDQAIVENWCGRVPSLTEPSLYHRWEGIYFTIYKDGIPDELYFEGASGD